MQHIIQAVHMAATVMDELSRMGGTDRSALQMASEQFMQHVQVGGGAASGWREGRATPPVGGMRCRQGERQQERTPFWGVCGMKGTVTPTAVAAAAAATCHVCMHPAADHLAARSDAPARTRGRTGGPGTSAGPGAQLGGSAQL